MLVPMQVQEQVPLVAAEVCPVLPPASAPLPTCKILHWHCGELDKWNSRMRAQVYLFTWRGHLCFLPGLPWLRMGYWHLPQALPRSVAHPPAVLCAPSSARPQ